MNYGAVPPIAIVNGITGQDGSYLAELLLNKGYKVIGLKRRTSTISTDRVNHIYEHHNFSLEYYDLNDSSKVYELLLKYKPQYFYNLAAQSHVKVSFEIPEHTVNGIVMGTLHILNAIKAVSPKTRFYQASSSEMFGDNPNMPETGFTEDCKFMPASPYACAKVCAHNLVRNYRKSYNLHASCGILFNHESPRRGETFVTRKITMAAAAIKLGKQKYLELGNMDALRDWGYAGDYVEAMWKILQQDKPGDYVIATGEMHTVKEFCKHVFNYAGLGDYRKYIKINPKYFRPHEVPKLLGDITKSKRELGWKPKTTFKKLAEMMYDEDYKLIKGE